MTATSFTATPPATPAAAFDRRQVENLMPLVPMQQGLLFHSLLAPAGGAYVPQVVLTLRGPLDAARLRQAWADTVARHAALRTSFHWEQREQPFQVTWRTAELPWVAHDVSGLPPVGQQARLQALLAAQRAEPFDLNRPPLMRLALLALGADRHQLVWCHHHLLLDGWSASLVLREVFARLHGLPLPPAPRPYADFVAWHQQRVRSGAQAASLDWWRGELQGLPAAAPLPLLRPSPRGGAARPAMAERLLPADAQARLRAALSRQGLTLATLLQAALGLLLRRYGQGALADESKAGSAADVVFGHTVAGRPAELPGALEMVGLFINTAPVRLRVQPALTVAAWLAQVQASRFTAAEHEHLPLRELQSLAAGGGAGSPLFDCLLVIENYPAGGALPAAPSEGPDGVRLASLAIEEATHYGLTLQASDGDTLRLAARWDARRADAADVERLLAHWQHLVMALVDQPDAAVGTLAMLSADEAAQLAAFGDGGPALGAGQPFASLADRFEHQARQRPEAVALCFQGRTMRYAALDRCANRLAWQLREAGVGREDIVALHFERSFELMVALLAVQKAGAAWLPLDTDQPAARLAAMLDDARPRVLLHGRADGAGLPACPEGTQRLPCADAAADGLDEAAELAYAGPPPRSTHPAQAAYLIYTSGSTGRPKGVLNHHAGIANRLAWMQRHLGLAPQDRVLQKTPVGFDVSVWELWWPLLEGATLVLAPPGVHRDRDTLAGLIAQERITVAHFVPAMLADFLQAAEVGRRAATLRHVVCSGEALAGPLQQQVFERLPGTALHNLYGPTEAAVDVTAWRCTPATAGAPVPIGRPIDGLQVRLLDADGHPVPVGVPGRLFIGGVGLARGYRRRPALTAERFVPDPFAQGPGGGLLYDSGDLARWRPDGAIDYLGRADDQFKLRGVRMEAGEIEAALLGLAGVRQAAVKLWPAAQGEAAVLAAYVVAEGPATEAGNAGAALQRALRERLPDAMVPSHIVVLDSLPLTPNGKPDRRALPRPAAPQQAFEAPRTDTERGLAEIWRETLQLPASQGPGLQDSFFELGGHSLVAMRIAARVRSRFGIELPLAAVFEHPTLHALAVHVDTLRAPSAAAGGYREVEL
ncbi:amino acid adenylation domain-containing protein [Aquincola sp. MAHUQ-54]|uniref:Amino acid adenylation domain-containing protein n=1 Tax=Aquincola agrisoli TaxID=3119538 RepID=A0AAW9Q2F3_9BURK